MNEQYCGVAFVIGFVLVNIMNSDNSSVNRFSTDAGFVSVFMTALANVLLSRIELLCYMCTYIVLAPQ